MRRWIFNISCSLAIFGLGSVGSSWMTSYITIHPTSASCSLANAQSNSCGAWINGTISGYIIDSSTQDKTFILQYGTNSADLQIPQRPRLPMALNSGDQIQARVFDGEVVMVQTPTQTYDLAKADTQNQARFNVLLNYIFAFMALLFLAIVTYSSRKEKLL